MIEKPKDGEKLYGLFDGEIKECIYWNWGSYSGEYTDVVTLNMDYEKPKIGDILLNKDKTEIKRRFLFRCKEEAIEMENLYRKFNITFGDVHRKGEKWNKYICEFMYDYIYNKYK